MKTKLKNLIPFALILFLLPVGALAYDKDDKKKAEQMQHRLEERLDRLEKRLELNAGQKEALQPVLSEIMGKRRVVLQDLREKTKVAMETIDVEEDAKLKRILSAEQMEKFEKMREKSRKKSMDRGHKSGQKKGKKPLKKQE